LYGIKIWTKLPTVLSQSSPRVWQTDRQLSPD